MIGGSAVLVWLMFVLFPVLTVAGIWGKRGRRIGPLSVLGTILAVFIFVMASYIFGRTLLYLHVLRSLKPGDVQSLAVDGILVSDTETQKAIIEALSQSVLFFPQHGGWVREFPLQIALKSGVRYDFRMAAYPSRDGVVVVSPRYAFSPSLSGALKKANINASQ